MSNIAARLWNQVIAAVCPHTSVHGDSWTRILNGTATSNGAAGGTTVIDTSADSGGANTYNGRYWVRMTSGTCEGEMKRIIDDDGAGTLTLENNGFSAQIDSGDQYQIIMSPEPVVVVDSSGGETDMVDAIRAEADVDDAEFWAGYYACPITGTHRGKIANITAFDPATGTFVLAASFGSALAAGDVVLLRRFFELGNASAGLEHLYHPRLQARTNFGKSDGVVGAKGGTIGFDVQAQASGSPQASGTAAADSPLRHLLTACGLDESVGTSATVGAASTTSAILIATGSWENFEIGQMVIHNGNAVFITSMTDGAGAEDTLNITPDLPVAPTSGDTVYGTRMYATGTTGDGYGCTLEIERDGVRVTMTGCKGSFDEAGEEVKNLSFSFNVDHWIREIEAAPYNPNTAYDTTSPVKAEERLVYLSETAACISGLTLTPGTVVKPKTVTGCGSLNGRTGYNVVDYNPGATYRELLNSSGELDADLRFTAQTKNDLIVVRGTHGATVAARIPSAGPIESAHPEDLNSMQAAPNVLEARDAGTATDGDGTVQKVPNFAYHLA